MPLYEKDVPPGLNLCLPAANFSRRMRTRELSSSGGLGHTLDALPLRMPPARVYSPFHFGH